MFKNTKAGQVITYIYTHTHGRTRTHKLFNNDVSINESAMETLLH